MADGLPGLDLLCVALDTGPGELCIEAPGGARICATFGYELGDPSKIVMSLLGQCNAALAPLTPFFNTLDVLKAIVDCVQAVPDAITQLDPSGLFECIPDMVKKLQKLLALIPQLSVPLLIVSILDVIIVGLLGLRREMQSMIAQLAKIEAAATRAAALGNVHLQLVVDCARDNLDAQVVNMNASVAPLNRLLGLINTLLELAGLPCLKTFSLSEEVGQVALDAIDAAITLLQAAKAAIPSPALVLEAIPGPNDPC